MRHGCLGRRAGRGAADVASVAMAIGRMMMQAIRRELGAVRRISIIPGIMLRLIMQPDAVRHRLELHGGLPGRNRSTQRRTSPDLEAMSRRMREKPSHQFGCNISGEIVPTKSGRRGGSRGSAPPFPAVDMFQTRPCAHKAGGWHDNAMSAPLTKRPGSCGDAICRYGPQPDFAVPSLTMAQATHVCSPEFTLWMD
jgi:hypothetical protein